MEQLLHYAWKHRLLPLSDLKTTHGEALEVVDVGLHNRDAGPDFLNAKVRIGGTLWAGNVELHLRSSDWARHGHDRDAAYNNVVLHIATLVDAEVRTQSGTLPAQLVMQIPLRLQQDYERLLSEDRYPRCHSIIPHLEPTIAHSWMDALLNERLLQRARLVEERLTALGGDWEKALFQTLARNFGFGLNGDAFQAWAALLPLQKLGKHRDDLFQIEAIFLGLAGMLGEARNEAEEADDYRHRLQHEFFYQKRLFSLPDPLPFHHWKYLRLRPQNFPHIRLAQLAWLYSQGGLTLSKMLDAAMSAKPLKALTELLHAETSEYWTQHIIFGKPTQKQRTLALSKQTRQLFIINTVAPLLMARANKYNDAALADRAAELLRQLPAEDNNILRIWQECGLNATTAADSQALIHMKKEYCDRHDCLRCRFGYEYMKAKLK